MDIALITIGSELLSGFTLNTNAQHIGKKLSSLGARVVLQLSVPDEKEAVFSALSYASKHASFVLTTGGIGKTLDDLTIEFVKEWVQKEEGAPFSFSKLKEKICLKEESLKKERIVDGPFTLFLLPNSLGGCRGILLELPRMQIACLPGVPYEMEQMLEELLCSISVEEKGATEMVYLFGLKEKQVDPALRKLQERYLNVQIGIYPNFICQSIRLEVAKKEQIPLLKECRSFIEKEFSSYVMPDCDGKIEKALYLHLISLKKTLSVAESCTGGRIASLLTQQLGVSSVFQGGVVAYSNQAKTDLLQVSKASIKKYGAVSKQVAIEMARQVKKRFQTAIGLSTTGIAGPSGGSSEKPVGTVWIGYSLEDGQEGALCIHTKGARYLVIERSSLLALGILYSLVANTHLPIPSGEL